MSSNVIDWNGSEIPSALKQLPPGRYVLEPLDEPLQLTPEEEAGILADIHELEQGQDTDAWAAIARVSATLPEA
jgi:hypothetical protein